MDREYILQELDLLIDLRGQCGAGLQKGHCAVPGNYDLGPFLDGGADFSLQNLIRAILRNDIHRLVRIGLVLVFDGDLDRLGVLGVGIEAHFPDVDPAIHDLQRVRDGIQEVQTAVYLPVHFAKGLDDAHFRLVYDSNTHSQRDQNGDGRARTDDHIPGKRQVSSGIAGVVLFREPVANSSGDGKASDGGDCQDCKQNNHFHFSFMCWFSVSPLESPRPSSALCGETRRRPRQLPCTPATGR